MKNKAEKTAAPPAKQTLPPGAEAEILSALSARMRISSEEIAAILKKHGVSGDVDALQDSYRKRLGQRLMAGIRDEGGKREVFAAGRDYVVVECCNDPQKLRAIQRRLQHSMSGLDCSVRKVRGRIQVLGRLASRLGKAG